MQLLNRDAPELFDYNSLYLFGWSGRLSAHERYWAATILYQKLTVLAESYQRKFGVSPIIRLVAHSHGGNVALNLAQIHKARKGPFSIDTLVLLACPVQHETRELVCSDLFIKIYAFYSSLDMVQVLAPEFIYKMRNEEGSVIGSCLRLIPFSNRCFASDMPVRQAWIKINGHGIMHGGFTTTKFLRTLPALLDTVDELYEEHACVLCKGKKELLLHVKSRCVNYCGERT
jgi:pimeloyl-ACP methyl ester carboxylesterase